MSIPSNDLHDRTISKTVSKSSNRYSTSSSEIEEADLKNKEAFVFPYYSEMARVAHPNQIWYLGSFLIMTLQFFISSLWVGSSKLWGTSNNYLIGIFYMCDLGVSRLSLSNCVAQYIVVIGYSTLIGIFLILAEWDYRDKHRFNKTSLYIWRVAQVLICPNFIPLDASLLAKALIALYQEVSSLSIFYSIVLLYINWVSLKLYLQTIKFSSVTSILDRGFQASWDPNIVYLIIVFMFLSCLLSQILDLFASWLTPFFILALSLGLFYVYRLIYFLPFHYQLVNVAVTAGITVSHANFIMAFVRCLTTKVTPIIALIVDFSVFFISLVVGYFALRHRRNKICKALSISAIGEASQVTEAMKRAYFDTIQFSSTDDAIAYLRVGVSMHCELFIDFSFLRYLVENYATERIVLSVTCVASFFPSELQFFSYCLSMIAKYKNLEVGDQYLYYQMKRLHILRQSSVSSEAVSTVAHLQKQSLEVIGAIRGFWKEIGNAKSEISFASLRSLYSYGNKVNENFLDATDKYPNNQAISDEYSNYLLEAMGNFSQAAFWKRRAHLIEQGKQLAVDHSFRSLVNIYPSYLTDKILDHKGGIISKAAANAIASSSSISIQSDSVISTNDVMPQGETEIGTLCDHGKLRLAIQKSMEFVELPSFKNSRIQLSLLLLCTVLMYGILFAISPNVCYSPLVNLAEEYYTSEVQASVQHIGYVSSVQMDILGNLSSGLSYLESFTNFEPSKATSMYEPLLSNYQRANSIISQLRSFLSDLMSDESSTIQNDIVNTSVNVDGDFNSSLKAGIVIFADEVLQSSIDGLSNSSLSEITQNSISLSSDISSMMSDVKSVGLSSLTTTKNTVYALGIALPCVFFIVFLYLNSKNFREIKYDTAKISDLLRKVRPEVIEESLKPISFKKQGEKLKTSRVISAHEANLVRNLYPVTVALSMLVAIAIIGYTVYETIYSLDSLSDIYGTVVVDSDRETDLLRAVTSICGGLSGALTDDNALAIANSSLSDLISKHESLISETTSTSTTIDDLHYTSTCDETDNYTAFLNCTSLDKKISLSEAFITNMIDDYQSLKSANALDNVEFASLIYLIDGSLVEEMEEFHYTLYSYIDNQLTSIQTQSLITWAVGIGMSVLFFLIGITLSYIMRESVETVKMLICFLPPLEVVKSKALINFVTGKKEEEDQVAMSLSESIVYHSSSAAVVVNSEEVIETINPAVQAITGFSPDQVLGQKISWLIPQGNGSSSSSDDGLSAAQFYQRLAQMKNGIGEKVAVVNVKCQSDLSSPVSLRATIIAMCDEKTDAFENFVLLLKDMSAEMKQKKEVQEAKTRTDKLLESLVPAKVLPILKQNSGSAVFISEMATVIFVEIGGIIECVNNLSPKQLMSTLGKIYDKIDEKAAKYPAVHALKTNDNLYIACCGLFDFKDNPQAQAEQAVCFCLELIQGIDTLNEELGLELKLRIGINMGGPMLGGVLNLKTPSFDILGNLVSLAVRMQGGGQTGCVQVGESVVHALPTGKYVVTHGMEFPNNRGPPEKSYIVVRAENANI